MIFINVSKAYLPLLMLYTLASATDNAALQARATPDLGVSVSKMFTQILAYVRPSQLTRVLYISLLPESIYPFSPTRIVKV